MRLMIFPLLLVSFIARAQITQVQQKALNSYVEYANTSANEISSVVNSFINYYPKIHNNNKWVIASYVCPIQQEEYYYNQVLAQNKNLSANISTLLNTRFQDLRKAAIKIDEKCKALDTYHKLEDYKLDKYAKAEVICNEMSLLLADYQKKQAALQTELENVFKKMTAAVPVNSYRKADDLMRQQVNRERAFIDSWTYNLNEPTHTGWPVELLEKSIIDTDARLTELKKTNPPLEYPASSMWTSFREALADILESKRSALNGYNFEAKKSDEHSNRAYLNLINYFNGTLVANYNMFLNYASVNYNGLRVIQYVPVFEIRSQAKIVEVTVKPFKDIPYTAVNFPPQKTALPKTVFSALSLYVEFINETWRQTGNLRATYINSSSDAAYYKTIDSFQRHGPMTFEYKNYEIPLAEYQKAITASKVLPPAIAKTLNNQTEVLLEILKEMDDQSASLVIETKERRYEKDGLKKVFEILERMKVLFQLWDDRKEQLYNDVRAVYDAYPVTNPAGSWSVSGKALRNLTQLDHDALFKAKAYYQGDTTITISTAAIDQAVRDVISKEFDNMKGIQKIGRNNGNCPYTPYEDLPKTSKTMSEELNELKPATTTRRYDHPYYKLLYVYNEVAREFNKFAELSETVPILATVYQPEMYFLTYPDPKKQTTPPPVVVAKADTEKPVVVTEPLPKSVEPKKETPATEVNPVRPVAKTERVEVHDTVYIEKRDTIYLHDPNENLRSMEGYAANNMILLLDVSGSMNSPEKLPLLKQSVLDMMSMMRPEDKVSILTFSEKPKVLLESTSFKDEAKLRKAIGSLKSSGKTDGNAGLKLAYKTADENYIRGGNNRIILATDGQFATAEETLALISKFAREDVFLSIFNFGKGMGVTRELQKLAALGNGNCESISKENVELKLIREAKAKKKK